MLEVICNGNYREIFEAKGIQYIGLDMESGPNVDIVPKNTQMGGVKNRRV